MNAGTKYDVKQYSDEELLRILDMDKPTDRELEAKLQSLISRYRSFDNVSGDRLAQFYTDIYNHMFDTGEGDDDVDADAEAESTREGFDMYTPTKDPYAFTPRPIGASGVSEAPLNPGNVASIGSSGFSDNSFNLGNVLSLTTDYRKSDYQKSDYRKSDNWKSDNQKSAMVLTKPLDYAKDQLNPLLTQTIRRIVSIDSQYRENKGNTFSTEFTFNLSEPLRDVVSLKLYSVSIPYAWYTISNAYGANFFYIKGNSPGIDTGAHDYKIFIDPGNYTSSELVSKINTNITEVINNHMDMSFGNTQLIYNGGLASTTSGTGKTEIQIDMTKVFGESNYQLQFPTWSSTLSESGQLETISAYMGFNYTHYYGTSIYSTVMSGTILFNSSNTFTFNLTPSNSTFQIVPYLGDSYVSRTSVYAPINVSFGVSVLTSYTRPQLISSLDSILKNNQYLDSNFSGIVWENISGANKLTSGSSFIEMRVKLNPKTMPIVANLKLAVVFPYITSDPLFYGTAPNSCFRFSNTYEKIIENGATVSIVCECSDIISEVPVLQSNYDPTDNDVIRLVCTASGYDSSLNNYAINYSKTTLLTTYNLDAYLALINSSISDASTELTGPVGTTSALVLDSGSNIDFAVHIRRVFDSSHYSVKAYGQIATIFGMTSGTQYDLSGDRVFSNGYRFTSITFTSEDKLVISPKQNTPQIIGNENADPFTINFDSTTTTYNNLALFIDYMNSKLSTYASTITHTYTISSGYASYELDYTPTYYSSITYENGLFKLNLVIAMELSQLAYLLNMTDAPGIRADLKFDLTYVLNDQLNATNLTSVVQNKSTLSSNEITVEASNNTFYLSPYSSVVGLQTSDNLYRAQITVPIGKYNITTLHAAINVQFAANPLTVGTTAQLYTDPSTGQIYTRIRLNVNKIFTTKDFRLVFYDPFSFVTCTSGGNRTIQNVTWDTTVGWILGFRESIIYYLSDYVLQLYSFGSTFDKYYLTGLQSNVCVINGDTCTNTTLYTYFLIVLDDYVQNHLNDGLVTLTAQDNQIKPDPYIMVCDPITKELVPRPLNYGSPGITYTDKQLYSFQQKVQSQRTQITGYSKGPFVNDLFGMIPIKQGTFGGIYTEFGGPLQNQDRLYFGPVNIHRMTIRLLNDRGDLVDLNKNDWNFSLICEQLYRNT